MATFKAVTGPRKKDGTHNVKIRLTQSGRVKYIATDIFIEPFQMRRNGEIRDPDIIDIVAVRYIRRFREIVAALEGSEAYTADELKGIIVERMKGGGFALDFFEYSERQMQGMRPNTAACYSAMLSALGRFVGRRKLDINDIDSRFVRRFREWIETNIGKGCRAASSYLSCMRHIHNLARAEFNDDDVGRVPIPREPFKGGVIPPQPVTRHRALTPEQIRAVAAAEAPTARAAMARDAFILSFMLIGINSADLYRCTKSALKDGVLTYFRAKTESRRSDRAEMQVRVEGEAADIMSRWAGCGDILFSFSRLYSTEKNFNKALNKGLKELSFAVDMPPLTFYHARHSWATIARNLCGVGRDTVTDALDHASRDKVTDIYIERSFSHVWAANRQVLDLVFPKKA